MEVPSALVSYIEQHVEDEHEGVEIIEVAVQYTDEKPVITHCPLCGMDCSDPNRKI